MPRPRATADRPGPTGPDRALPRPALRSVATLVALVLAIGHLLVFSATPPAAAGTLTSPFSRMFSADVHGTVLLRGNTLMTCDPTASTRNGAACERARQGQTGAGNDLNSNNHFLNRFVDVDGDPTTFTSSSATLTVPDGGTVLYAALVWSANVSAGEIPPGTTLGPAAKVDQRFTVKFRTPTTGYTPVTATGGDAVDHGRAYQGFADVTDQVRAGGSGVYTVADVQSGQGVDRYAGWSLVIAVSDPLAPLRNLTVFRGFGMVGSENKTVDVPVSGFLTPSQGTVKTRIGLVAWEGDDGWKDGVRLAGRDLADPRNPAGNVLNSTITDSGIEVAGRNPSYANQLGVDIDVIDADGYLANGSTSTTVTLTTAYESYYPGVVSFATDLYEPMLEGTKTVTDLDGGTTGPGDVLEYAVELRSTGVEDAVNSRFVDAVPTGTRYVPGSLSVDGVTLTDAAGDDTGRFDGTSVVVNIGDGATATAGGRMPGNRARASTVRFRVQVEPGVGGGAQLTNIANTRFDGATTGVHHAAASTTAITTTHPAPAIAPPRAEADTVEFVPTTDRPSVRIPVLANDAAGLVDDTLVITGTTAPAGGSVVVRGDEVVYTPAPDAAGRDAFTYTVRDPRGATSAATVSVTVVNSAPTTENLSASTPAGTSLELDLPVGAKDPNGDPVGLDSVPATSRRGGQLLADRTTGRVRYTPAPGFRGTDFFEVTARDARGATTTASVTVTVTNRAPVAGADEYSLQTGVPTPISVLDNDSDPDGDPMTATLVSGPSDGTLTFGQDGRGTYTPARGFSGTDGFTYRVGDGTGSSTDARVTLRVNGSPTVPQHQVRTETSTALSVAVLAGAADPDLDTVHVSSVGRATHGTTELLPDELVRYTPATGWAGDDVFDFTVIDGRGGAATGQVQIEVANAAPRAVADRVTTRPGRAVTVDVVANDTDANLGATDQELSISGVSLLSGSATFSATARSVTVEPARGSTAPVELEYTVTDGEGGQATARLLVELSLDAPIAVPDGPVAVGSGASVDIDVLGNDESGSGDPLAVVLDPAAVPVAVSGRAAGHLALVEGKVRFTPRPGFAGSATFDYAATDGTMTSAPTTVTVVVANALPQITRPVAPLAAAHGDVVVVDVLPGVDDDNVPSGDQLLRVVSASAEHAVVTIRAGGVLEITPEPVFKGRLEVRYEVVDGAGGSVSGRVDVLVANAPPIAAPDRATVRGELDLDVTANDEDPNLDALAVVPGSLSQVVPVEATPLGLADVTVTLSTDGRLHVVPGSRATGTVRFSYDVTDGEDVAGATVTLELQASALPVPTSIPVPTPVPTPVPSTVPTTVPTTPPTPGETTPPSFTTPPVVTPEPVVPTAAPSVTLDPTAAPAATSTSVPTQPVRPAQRTRPAQPGTAALHPQVEAVSALAVTGAEVTVLLLLGCTLVLAGATVLALTRRTG